MSKYFFKNKESGEIAAAKKKGGGLPCHFGAWCLGHRASQNQALRAKKKRKSTPLFCWRRRFRHFLYFLKNTSTFLTKNKLHELCI
jgi:hypothetical protein